jgi:hypothetical protein
MNIAEKIFNHKIKYGKAWRAKQRAWKMIYGDWEEGYEKLPALFNAMKSATPACISSTSPNEWKDGRQIFFHAFWCFPHCMEVFKHCQPVFSIDGTFLIGKYEGTLLVAISVHADNALVPFVTVKYL